jgi:hypothetical protein
LLLDERDLLLDERLPPDELFDRDDEPLGLEPCDLARPEDDFFADEARPEVDFFADDELRFGEDLLDEPLDLLDDPPRDLLDAPPDLLEELDDFFADSSPAFCDGCWDFACGDDPLEGPLLCPTSLLTPPTTLVATPIPSRPTFFQSVRRRPTGRPSTVERRLILRGLFMVASL